MAPTCRDKDAARRPLQGKAGAGEGLIEVTRGDGGSAVAPEDVHRSAGRPRGRRVEEAGRSAGPRGGGCTPAERVERPSLKPLGPDAGRHIVKRRPPSRLLAYSSNSSNLS
jgi:hypothetical protein